VRLILLALLFALWLATGSGDNNADFEGSADDAASESSAARSERFKEKPNQSLLVVE